MSEQTALECLKYYFSLPSMEHSGEAESFAKLLAVVDAAKVCREAWQTDNQKMWCDRFDELIAALTALDSP